MKWKTVCLLGFVTACLLAAAYDMALYWNDMPGSLHAKFIANTASVVFLVLWLDADSHDHPQIYRPFEFRYLLLFLWAPYLPYYLWRTRGPSGLVLCIGVAALLFAGLLGQWAIYSFR